MAFIENDQETKEPTANDLTRRFYYNNLNGSEFIVANCYIHNSFEADIMRVMRSGYAEEIEVKLSVSDFKKDFEKTDWHGKPKHESIQAGEYYANRFYFYVPFTIAEKVRELVPDYAGFIIFTENDHAFVEKKAPLLHKNKITDSKKLEICRKYVFKFWDLKNRTTK